MSNVVQLSKNMSYSSFGAEQTQGGGFRARALVSGERFAELDRRQAYYDCTQHDGRRYDFDGRIVSARSGAMATQPLIGGEKASWYVPLSQRRPSAPYRLPRVIVNAFTSLLFGENRFPHVKVEGDTDTQDFLQTICRVGCLPARMIRARNLGGSMGTVGLAWCFKKGKPVFSVHNAKNLHVAEWEDREQLIPAHVVECFEFPRDEWDAEKKRVVRNLYWYRRDWTQDADLVYPEMLSRVGVEPQWNEPDMKRSFVHKDGRIHFEWIQNMPDDDVDGVPDYEGLYENFEAIDMLYSVNVRGAILNLDPTLKLKMDPDLIQRTGVQKGSDKALIVGVDGDASYMELTGSSIDAGLKLFESLRRSVLEVAQCIVPDPSEVAAQGVSSVTIKALYAPMLAKADVLREQYGSPLERILSDIATVARKASKSRIIITDGDGKETEADVAFDLPPRIEQGPILDEDGKPTGEDKITKVPRMPGEGGEVCAQWPPFFQPTPADQASAATTMQTATGGKAFISKQSAVELTARAFGIEPGAEWKRVEQQNVSEQQQSAAMFADADAGGKVTHEQLLPGGAKIKRTMGAAAPAGKDAPDDDEEDADEEEEPEEKK